jgi:hypothetical protein
MVLRIVRVLPMDLPEDGAWMAETRSRHLVTNTNIQLDMCS